MSRSPQVFLASAALAMLAPGMHAGAQSAIPSVAMVSTSSALLAASAAPRDYTITMAPIAAPSALAPRARAAEGQSGVGQSIRAAIGVAVGAAVGGWIGYFGAQVANSDWDRISASQKTSLRQGYTAAGLGVGAIVGYFLRPKGRHEHRFPSPLNVPARSGRLLLGSAELRRSIATNVLEAVELARPEWTKQQREDEAKHGDPSTTDPVEKTSLVVYVGDEKVGALETLRDVAIPEVAELRFYDARDARRRWGTDHKYGAIEIVPAGAASTGAASTGAAGTGAASTGAAAPAAPAATQ
jgi:hypothetical protein